LKFDVFCSQLQTSNLKLQTMEDNPRPLKVDSIPEEYDYIASLRCDRCGGVYRAMKQALLINGDAAMDAIDVVCQACGQGKHLLFDISSFYWK
jgi:hypothetical protein